MDRQFHSRLVDDDSEGKVEECLLDGTEKLLVLAPHGGAMEPYTDTEARRAAQHVPQATCWFVTGLARGGEGEAFDKWHITSRKISEDTFTLLQHVAGREYTSAVSFHGTTRDSVHIGGRASEQIKQEVADGIAARLPDTPTVVDGEDDPFPATSSENIVNRYAVNGGVQIEQPFHVRQRHWKDVVDAVVDVLDV